MTDEERTDELTQKAEESYKIYSEDKCIDTYEGYQYTDGYCNGYEQGYEEGRKEGFDAGYKKATERAYERQQDLTDTYIKDGEKIEQLKKETAELKSKSIIPYQKKGYIFDEDLHEIYFLANGELMIKASVVEEMKAQIEKMKCCRNCKHYGNYKDDFMCTLVGQKIHCKNKDKWEWKK